MVNEEAEKYKEKANAYLKEAKYADAIKEYNKIDSDITMYDNRNGDLPFNCYIIRTRALKKVIHKKKETDTEVWLKYFLSDSSFKINVIEPGENYQHRSSQYC